MRVTARYTFRDTQLGKWVARLPEARGITDTITRARALGEIRGKFYFRLSSGITDVMVR